MPRISCVASNAREGVEEPPKAWVACETKKHFLFTRMIAVAPGESTWGARGNSPAQTETTEHRKNYMKTNVIKRLSRYMNATGANAYRVWDYTGINPSNTYDWLLGNSKPSARNVAKLERFLGRRWS
jgi:hypothetical protein